MEIIVGIALVMAFGSCWAMVCAALRAERAENEARHALSAAEVAREALRKLDAGASEEARDIRLELSAVSARVKALEEPVAQERTRETPLDKTMREGLSELLSYDVSKARAAAKGERDEG